MSVNSTSDSDTVSDSTSQYEQIPTELKEREQWLLWDSQADTPRQPHWAGDFSISWSDPDDWRSFKEACKVASKKDSWGIGYVVALDNDDYARGVYGCLDIDDALREANQEKPKDWVPSLGRFTDANAYMEYSASGEGIHIPIVGQEPPEWWSDSHFSPEEHEGVDYLTNKFVAFTGDKVASSGDNVTDINPNSWLFDAYKAINSETPRIEENTDNQEEYNEEYLDTSDIEDALSNLNPDCSHSEWIRVAYAVHDFDSSSTGKGLFEQWSKRGQKWDKDAKRSIDNIWSGANQGSGVGVGTLIYKARQNGWELPAATADIHSKGGESTEETPFKDAIDASWFNQKRQKVTVQETAEYNSRELAQLFRNPDDLPTEATLAINEVEGGPEFLKNADSWHVQTQTTDPFADMSTQDLKNAVLREIPVQRIAYIPKREEWFWCAESGIWQTHGQEDIRQWLDEFLGEHYRRKVRNEVMDQLKARVRFRESAFGGGPTGAIATKSGLVDLQTGECQPINPEHKVRWQLGVEYDPTAECPNWKAFLGNVAKGGDIPMLQEYVGYCLHHWNLPLKKALIIFGPTDAGKSVFVDVIRALFGGDESPATSSTSIQYLANKRWGPARLVNTAVNIRNDLDSSTIENTGKIKELIAGDALDAERKRKPVFKFSPTAKHIFVANRAPDRKVDDEAFWNRWLTVMFPQSIPRSEQDPNLTDELIAELPGILNWAIEGHQRLMEQGQFTNEPLPYQNREKWERYGNSIEQWFDRFTVEEPEAFTPKYSTEEQLGAYDSYVAFARKNGLEVKKDGVFTSELKRRQGVSKTRRRKNGSRVYGYSGFELAEDAPGLEESEEAEETDYNPGESLDTFEGES